MHSLRTIIFVFCTAFLMPAAANAGSYEEQVKLAYAAWDAAFNKGDAKAIAAFYTDDAMLLPASHEIIKGPAGIEKFFAGLFANGVTGHQLEMIEVNSDAESAVAAAKWSAKGKDASGADASFGGLATHLFKKDGDGLKLKLHTFN